MKKLFLLSLIFGLISPSLNAKSLCTFTSEEEPDVTITMKNVLATGGGIGTLNYKNKPSLYFEVGRWNGYGGEYYVARSYSPESFTYVKKYVERIKNTEKISSGRLIIFVGNQIGRVMNREERKYGKLRAFMPTLPQGYYYSIPFTEKGEYGRQKLSKEMKTILDASEGFFVDTGGCSKFFGYGGN